MGVVGRLDQYASTLAWEFDETTANNPSITGLGTYYASEFNENVIIGTAATATIVTSGLVLNLDAGNPLSYPGSGTTWTDISGSGNNGTLQGSPIPTYSSNNGGFFTFNGTNNEVTTTTQFANPQTFSIGAWFKTSTASGNKIIGFENAQTGTGSFQFDRHIWIGTDGKLYFGIYSGGAVVATSPLTYNDNIWHYVIATYGGEGTTMRLYVDGASVATASANAPAYNGYWRIGAYQSWGGTGYFPGSISLAQVYNRGITAAEVLQNYNALVGRYEISSSISANIFSPYDPVYDEFGGTLFGAGQGRYMRQNTDKSVIVYNEIDEITDFYGRGIVRDGLVLDLDAGITASYPGSGTTWTDLSGNNYTHTLGSVSFATVDGASCFNISSPGFIRPSGTSYTFGSSHTMIAWARPLADSQVSNWRTLWRTSPNDHPLLIQDATNLIGYFDNDGANFVSYGLNLGTLGLENKWTMFSLVASGGTTTLYINNGSSTGSVAYTASGNSHYAIGSNAIDSSQPFGYVSVAQLYNRALTAAEISQNFNALRGRFGL